MKGAGRAGGNEENFTAPRLLPPPPLSDAAFKFKTGDQTAGVLCTAARSQMIPLSPAPGECSAASRAAERAASMATVPGGGDRDRGQGLAVPGPLNSEGRGTCAHTARGGRLGDPGEACTEALRVTRATLLCAPVISKHRLKKASGARPLCASVVAQPLSSCC